MGKVGRPAHKVTEENKKNIEMMSAVGIIHEQIAAYLNISVDTLTKYYPDELRIGAIKANTKVAGSLYTQAINGNVTAQIFWCKTRMGWKEKSEVELTGQPLTAILQIGDKK